MPLASPTSPASPQQPSPSPSPPLPPIFIAWQSEPSTRGTWSLMTSCVLTLLVCVYTAVHLNVAGRDDTYRQRVLRRCKWVALGTLAPELVVYNAWRQWDTARELTREIENLRMGMGTEDDNALLAWTKGWTMVHSFFCVMGGFVIDLNLTSGNCNNSTEHPSRPQRLTLTPKGALRAAALNLDLHPPTLTQEAIKDRSKADSVAKLLASIQAGYMALQLVGRVVDGLPVTELEVNTLGHVMCALIIFFFWMRKPLDVRDPVVIAHEWVVEVGTYWAMSLNRHTMAGSGGGGGGVFEDSESEAAILNRLMEAVTARHPTTSEPGSGGEKDKTETRNDEISPVADAVVRMLDVQIFDRWPCPSDHWTRDDVVLVVGDVVVAGSPCPSHSPPMPMPIDELKETILAYEPWSSTVTRIYCSHCPPTEYHARSSKAADSPLFEVSLGMNDLERWHLGWRGRQRDGDDPSHNLVERAKNWSREDSSYHLNSRRAWVVTPVIALATALYGGLHLLLWDAHFPTPIERWLWRGASLIIAASGLTAVPFVLADNIWGIDMDERTAGVARRWLAPVVSESSLAWSGEIGYYLVIGTVLLLYGAARAFLVVEAFVGLRSLPLAAYQTPDWSQWIPHL